MDIHLLNIAGEIVNLRGKEGNSERATEKQFHALFTNTDDEIAVLKKVFGIPTLRHTPTILTDPGCSLTEEEAAIIKRILKSRLQTLQRGFKLSSGMSAASTKQKIRNYENLLRRLREFTGSDLPPCEPPKVVEIFLPKAHLGLPSWGNKAIKEILLMVLLLLTGLANNEIRGNNIRTRLGTTTLEEIATKIQSRKVTTANVKGYLGSILPEPAFRGLLAQQETITEQLIRITKERDRLEAELKGKNDAIQQLQELLEQETRRGVDLAGRIGSNDDALRSDLESAKTMKTDLEAHIMRLEQERVQTNERLQLLNQQFEELKRIADGFTKRFEEAKEKARADYEDKINELEAVMKQKEEIQEQKDEQYRTLTAQKKETASIKEEKEILKKEIEDLQLQVTELRKKEETMIADVVRILGDLSGANNTPENTLLLASQESIRTRIKVLDALFAKNPERSDIKQALERLKASLTTEQTGGKDRAATTNISEELQNLLLQTALIDSNEDLFTEQVESNEPVKEKLCLLLIFVELFYKYLNNSVQEDQEDNRIIDNIDEILLGKLEEKDLWPKIILIGKIIDGFTSGLLPEYGRLFSTKISFELLTSRLKTVSKDLPNSEKGLDIEHGKLIEKNKNTLDLPILFLLEMKLLSRYSDYIINKAPHKLVCSGQVTEPSSKQNIVSTQPSFSF